MLVIGLSRERAGVETYILNMARVLSVKKFELFFPANGAEETYGEELLSLGHHFIKTPAVRGRHFISFYRNWNQIFRDYQFDGVYLNDCSMVQIDLLRLAKWHKVPVRVFHAHSSSWMGGVPSFVHRLMAKWNKWHITTIATRLLSCSQESAEWMFPPNSHYKIIRNAIDVQKYSYSVSGRIKIRTELAVGDAPLIGFIGRFEPEKSPEYFVRTFSEMRKQLPDAIALMVGDGILRSSVEQAIDICKLPSGSIRLLGVRHDIPDIMSALDCLVMTSLIEGFPFILVEAQASGLPCIVSDRIPQETNITDDLTFVSLDKMEDWSPAIRLALASEMDRRIYSSILRDKGYDIEGIVSELEAELLEDIERSKRV